MITTLFALYSHLIAVQICGGLYRAFLWKFRFELSRGEVLCRLSLLDAELIAERRKVDLKVIDKYREKSADLDRKQAELERVTEQRNAARGEHDELRKKRLEEFMHGFGIISSKLQEIYQMITIGGDAELNVVDSLDPFSEVCCALHV
jgi:structural maintenance of chromosome 4